MGLPESGYDHPENPTKTYHTMSQQSKAMKVGGSHYIILYTRFCFLKNTTLYYTILYYIILYHIIVLHYTPVHIPPIFHESG